MHVATRPARDTLRLMSTAAARIQAAQSLVTTPRPFRFTVDEYYLLAEAGAFPEGTHIELIEGEIIEMPPPSPAHCAHVTALSTRLIRLLPLKYEVRSQMGVRFSHITEPQPDITIVKARADYYNKAHPGAEDTLLLIEVSKSSLKYDLERKAGVYAKSGLKEYWVLDLKARRLHVFTGPAADGWKNRRTLTPREEVQSLTVPELKLKVSELFV
jgi:Uma2 family endonuclease